MAPRGDPLSPGDFPRGTPPPSRRPTSPRGDSDYDSDDEEGPTVFGSVLRTVLAGAAVVAIALLVGGERQHRDARHPPSLVLSTPSLASPAMLLELSRAHNTATNFNCGEGKLGPEQNSAIFCKSFASDTPRVPRGLTLDLPRIFFFFTIIMRRR